MDQLYISLGTDAREHDETDRIWHLPTAGKPGVWMPPAIGDLSFDTGYVLYRFPRVLKGLGPRLYAADYRGDLVDLEDQVIVRQARLFRWIDTWNEQTQRLFAADCAERVVYLFEQGYPHNDWASRAIAVARQFANGEIGNEQRLQLARATPIMHCPADDSCSSDGQYAAEEAKDAALVAIFRSDDDDRTYSALMGARTYAARAVREAHCPPDTAGCPAECAEREWQRNKLLEYLKIV